MANYKYLFGLGNKKTDAKKAAELSEERLRPLDMVTSNFIKSIQNIFGGKIGRNITRKMSLYIHNGRGIVDIDIGIVFDLGLMWKCHKCGKFYADEEPAFITSVVNNHNESNVYYCDECEIKRKEKYEGLKEDLKKHK